MQSIQNWHDTRSGYAVFGVAELALCILLASLAVNSGSLWQWTLAIIFLAGFVQNTGRLALNLLYRRSK